jgi:hypothetical protein
MNKWIKLAHFLHKEPNLNKSQKYKYNQNNYIFIEFLWFEIEMTFFDFIMIFDFYRRLLVFFW